jgi:hypothetical protein
MQVDSLSFAVFTSLSVGQIPFSTEILRLVSFIVVDTYRSYIFE